MQLDETHRSIMRLSRAPPKCSDADPIPDHVHQPWTGGATMRWEQVLAVASVRFLGKPKRFTVYYDASFSVSGWVAYFYGCPVA